MNKKIIIPIVVIVLLGAVAGGFYFFSNKQADTKGQASSTTTSQIQGATTSPRQVDNNTPSVVSELRGIAPQFVDDKEIEGVPLPPSLKKVKETARSILIAQGPGSEEFYESLLLRAVGERYVLVAPPSMRPGCNEIIIDFLNKTSISGGGEYCYRTKSATVYINYNKISYYKLGNSSFAILPQSELPKGETYHAGDQDIAIHPIETHTDKTMTISVFDDSILIENSGGPNGNDRFKKLRDVTFALP